MEKPSRSWNAGCGESYLSGVGSAGRKPTVERQQGAVLRLHVRFTELQSRPLEFLDCTSLTLEEFQQLVPPFETAFHARMTWSRTRGLRIIISSRKPGVVSL